MGRYSRRRGAASAFWREVLSIFLGFFCILVLEFLFFYAEISAYLPDLALLLLVFLALFLPRNSLLVWAFCVGVLVDVFAESRLGLHATLYLACTYLTLISRQRLSYYTFFQRILFFALLLFVEGFLQLLLFSGAFQFLPALWKVVSSTLLSLILLSLGDFFLRRFRFQEDFFS